MVHTHTHIHASAKNKDLPFEAEGRFYFQQGEKIIAGKGEGRKVERLVGAEQRLDNRIGMGHYEMDDFDRWSRSWGFFLLICVGDGNIVCKQHIVLRKDEKERRS